MEDTVTTTTSTGTETVTQVIKRKKILILTASPQRDLAIDRLLSEKLIAMGNEVFIRPCLREGRDAVLELQPDVCVVPPIRNPFSRDMVETMKRFGCGVVTRHTEPSCDWQDFKGMDERGKLGITGAYPYQVDLELVWGPDEAQILNQRHAPFPAISVGAFCADVYTDPEVNSKYISKEVLFQKHGLDLTKKTILVLTAWGFIDMAPDLQIDEIGQVSKDTEGRGKWMEMIKFLKDSCPQYNILVTLHPNVDAKPYKDFLTPLRIPLDEDCRAIELVKNSDVVIHAGSTTAVGTHFLNKPAIQYGDQNSKDNNWWTLPSSAISKLSPFAPTLVDLQKLITEVEFDKTNASPETLKLLETGRYGVMDGQATTRAAELINKANGRFKYFWPDLERNYDQPGIMKTDDKIIHKAFCGVCKRPFVIVKQSYIDTVCANAKSPRIMLPTEKMCAHCGTRLITETV